MCTFVLTPESVFNSICRSTRSLRYTEVGTSGNSRLLCLRRVNNQRALSKSIPFIWFILIECVNSIGICVRVNARRQCEKKTRIIFMSARALAGKHVSHDLDFECGSNNWRAIIFIIAFAYGAGYVCLIELNFICELMLPLFITSNWK